MNWIPFYWQDLDLAITTAWPDLTKIYRTSQIERLHWLNKFGQGQLIAPFVIVEEPKFVREPGYGARNVIYRPRQSVWYVGKAQLPGVKIMTEFLEAKGAALQDILNHYSYRWTMQDDLEIDASERNRVMTKIIEGNITLAAVEVNFSVIIGYC